MDIKKEILSLLKSIDREGIDTLIEHIQESTYFKDPASTIYHNAYEGGLADYNYNVFKNLDSYRAAHPELDKYEDSIKIIGLLHSLGSVGTFTKIFKNLPLKDGKGKNIKDDCGKLIFRETEVYDVDYTRNLPYPKGQNSNIKIKQFIKLTKLEDLAIYWHQGILDVAHHMMALYRQALQTHKLILFTTQAVTYAQLYGGIKNES